MADIRVLHSLTDITPDAWNACFPGELEDHAYLLAIEESGMAGFHWRYLAAFEANRLVAAIPAFLTDYALDTTLEGTAKKITGRLRKLFPKMLTMKLACLGSPDTETGTVGFHASMAENERPVLLRRMLAHFEKTAGEEGYRLLGLKDIPAAQQSLWEQVTTPLGYCGTGGLPVAHLTIDFSSEEEYLSRLSSGTRKDMRRKLKSRELLRIEERRTIDDVLPEVMALYQQTRARADMQFEDLTPRFFQQVLSEMPDNAFCTLYYAGDALLAANLLLKNDQMLLDKFFCMEGEQGRTLNLYFLSWFTNVGYCIKHGLTRYQSGQASYENKLRLGSKLDATRMYFRHTNPLLHSMLKLAAPFLAAEDETSHAASATEEHKQVQAAAYPRKEAA